MFLLTERVCSAGMLGRADIAWSVSSLLSRISSSSCVKEDRPSKVLGIESRNREIHYTIQLCVCMCVCVCVCVCACVCVVHACVEKSTLATPYALQSYTLTSTGRCNASTPHKSNAYHEHTHTQPLPVHWLYPLVDSIFKLIPHSSADHSTSPQYPNTPTYFSLL